MAFQVTEVQKALKGADYPMNGQELADLATKNGGPDDLIEALRGVGRVDGPNTVMKELKGSLGGSTPDKDTEPKTKDVQGPSFQVTEVQKALKGAKYPMAGKDLAALAKSNGGSDDLVEALRGVREVDGPNTVMKEIKSSLGGPTDS